VDTHEGRPFVVRDRYRPRILKGMRVLVIGSGAREHALAWKLAQEPIVRDLYCAPGNAGTGRIASNVAIAADDAEGLAAWAEGSKIDLTVVGPEAALAAGVADLFAARGLRIVGPRAAAARIESSKSFAKDFMARHGIPTAPFELCDDAEAAWRFLRGRALDDYPVVIKADGLAAGKGVTVAATPDEARAALDALSLLPGAAGRVVVEEFLRGTELSVIALTDGVTVLPLPPARDYKRLADGNSGPMTGGMGAYSPPGVVTDELLARVTREALEPAVRGLEAEGAPYRGFLYAGLMLTPDGPRVLEFNARLGDPEAQCILPRLQSPLLPLLFAAAEGTLDEQKLVWRAQSCCAVVMASGGYPGPGPMETGYGILGLDEVEKGALVFHGATRDPYVKETVLVQEPQKRERVGGFSMFGFGRNRSQRIDRQARQAVGDPYSRTITAGGRVLTVAALGDTLAQARAAAYRNAERIAFTDRYYRSDIGADD